MDDLKGFDKYFLRSRCPRVKYTLEFQTVSRKTFHFPVQRRCELTEKLESNVTLTTVWFLLGHCFTST